MSDYEKLVRAIGYQFTHTELLQQALTHRSASSRHNERLEFLGDSVLNLIISTELFSRFPNAQEGELSRMRASLVKGETLAELSRELTMGDYLALGSGELKSGGFRRESILADVYEALIGAIYLDGGFEAARHFVMQQFSVRLHRCNPEQMMKDPKTRLQEYQQQRGFVLPEYQVVSTEGQEHDQTFQVACVVSGLETATLGEGRSRRKAEQAAAEEVLKRLGI